MKKIILISFLLSFHFVYAGTGSGNDEILFILAIMAILLFILAVLYSIDFVRKIIKERKEKKIDHHTDEPNSEYRS
jgi:Ca2+/H+ antiporter